LWIGTHKENTQDSFKKRRRPHEKNRAISAGKITEEQVREIRELYKNGSSHKELQEKFKLSQSQISGIVTYRFWRHVT
jgi:DNA-binding MarR family transcriptional regulator